MNPFATAAVVFASLFSAALLGMRLRERLPQHHLNTETKEAVRIGMGSVATMAALVLGLMVTSTKRVYDTEKSEVMQMAAKIAYLDRVLDNYGPETAECRVILRRSVQAAIRRIWPKTKEGSDADAPATSWTQELPRAIQNLSPRDDAQRTFKSQAAQVAGDLGQTRWLLFEQSESSISVPLLVIVVLWLVLTFMSVGLFAPSNATAVAAQLMAALSVSGAIFLILDLDRPFTGLVTISSEPMLHALSQLAK
jgi:hypothetical protein